MPPIPLPFSNRSALEWISHFQSSNAAEERVLALQAIKSLGSPEEVFRWASLALTDQDSSVRALAAKLMGSTGTQLTDQTLVQLKSILDDPDPDVRFEASRTLIRNRTDQIEPAAKVLLDFLDEPETHALMVAAVITTLTEGELAEETVTTEFRPRLFSLVDHERAEVREAVATAFARWPIMAATDTDQLIPLLDDSEPIVREKIAIALGESRISSETIKSALQSATTDEDVGVARHATEALRKLEFH